MPLLMSLQLLKLLMWLLLLLLSRQQLTADNVSCRYSESIQKKLIAERRVVVVVVGWNTQHQMVIMWHNGSHDVVFCDKIRD